MDCLKSKKINDKTNTHIQKYLNTTYETFATEISVIDTLSTFLNIGTMDAIELLKQIMHNLIQNKSH